MRRALLYLCTMFVGAFLGGLSALWIAGLVGQASLTRFATINVDGWSSDPSIGSASANAYTRARIARHGLLALAKEEAMYFGRNTDDDGGPLLENCIYELSGGPQDAVWWSITLYDGDSRLPMNDEDHLSLDATTTGNEDLWTATISAAKPESGFWISSRSAGQFDLTLRVYRPAESVIDDPETGLFAPKIRKISCEEGI